MVVQVSLKLLDRTLVITVFQVFIQDLGHETPNGTIVNKTVLKKGTQYHVENGDIVVS
jgi:hypothetical protein